MRMLGYEKCFRVFDNEIINDYFKKLVEKLNDANHKSNEEFIAIVDEFSCKKGTRKKEDVNDGPCEPELDDINRTMRNDGKY